MNHAHNHRLVANSQTLRKQMTKEERRLWYDFLKLQPFPVHRQKIFGSYIVDFYIACAKLVIELDGSQHYDESGRQKDQERDSFLNSLGILVLRFSNLDIQQRFEGVCEHILHHVNARKRLPLEGKLSPQATDEV